MKQALSVFRRSRMSAPAAELDGENSLSLFSGEIAAVTLGEFHWRLVSVSTMLFAEGDASPDPRSGSVRVLGGAGR
tara:strand:+ start:545 stop:772 length:228 start_codon:yes stop_codon:yes gene_type:complete